MPADSAIVIQDLNHHYGAGALRRQILFDISVEVRSGEIVILTGPSGSGKTTLLTLIGALRAAQDGSVRVLGQELRGARERDLVNVRKHIGYIFQAHNLLEWLPTWQNVEMSLRLHRLSARESRRRSIEALEAVGLGERTNHYPDQLSGGQKQRVAIARALATRPRLILADEPTASLDKKSGRDVVQLMHDLAKQHGGTVVLVTHDNRILDIADRILDLEDGRLLSFREAVLMSTQQMFALLAQSNRSGELTQKLAALPTEQFVVLLDQVTQQFDQFRRLVTLSNNDAFESMMEQVLEAFTIKIGQILGADRSTLFLVDFERGELWSKVAQSAGEKPLDIRMPINVGIAGSVATTGKSYQTPNAYDDPLFNPEVDRQTGYRTGSILCVPIVDEAGRVFAVAQLINKNGGAPFTAADEQQLREFANSIGTILQSWGHWGSRLRDAKAEAGPR